MAAPAPAPAPASRPPAPPRGEVPVQDVLVIAGGALILTCIAYAVLARMYYLDKLLGDFGGSDMAEELAKNAVWGLVRHTFFFSFLTFAATGTAAITLAVLYPRQVGHGLAVLFGLTLLGAAAQIQFRTPMPPMIAIFLAALGALLVSIAAVSYLKKDRAAWAFGLATTGTLAIFMLFVAPKIRTALGGAPLWYVMTLPAVMAAAAVGFYRMRHDHG